MTAHQTERIIQKYAEPIVGAVQRLSAHAMVNGTGQTNPITATNHNIEIEAVRALVGHHASKGPTTSHV